MAGICVRVPANSCIRLWRDRPAEKDLAKDNGNQGTGRPATLGLATTSFFFSWPYGERTESPLPPGCVRDDDPLPDTPRVRILAAYTEPTGQDVSRDNSGRVEQLPTKGCKRVSPSDLGCVKPS